MSHLANLWSIVRSNHNNQSKTGATNGWVCSFHPVESVVDYGIFVLLDGIMACASVYGDGRGKKIAKAERFGESRNRKMVQNDPIELLPESI